MMDPKFYKKELEDFITCTMKKTLMWQRIENQINKRCVAGQPDVCF